jgi:hypothetical protein
LHADRAAIATALAALDAGALRRRADVDELLGALQRVWRADIAA